MNLLRKINYKIKKIYFYKKYNFFQFIRISLNINQKIQINNFLLILPPKHLFSLYKKKYKNYDKFLVNLTKKLKKKDSLIDIGANVGDTLFQIIQKKSKFNYFCIEGDKFFYSYLEKNVMNLPNHLKKKIKIIQEIVGKNLLGKLTGSGGTKSFEYDKLGKKSKSLNEIVENYKIKKIKIIKIDVDGYDFNVINSGFKIIKKYKPVIYFEIMIINELSLKNYKDTIIRLSHLGYVYWTILDNYGNKIFENEKTSFFLRFINDFKFGDLFDVACSVQKLKN